MGNRKRNGGTILDALKVDYDIVNENILSYKKIIRKWKDTYENTRSGVYDGYSYFGYLTRYEIRMRINDVIYFVWFDKQSRYEPDDYMAHYFEPHLLPKLFYTVRVRRKKINRERKHRDKKWYCLIKEKELKDFDSYCQALFHHFCGGNTGFSFQECYEIIMIYLEYWFQKNNIGKDEHNVKSKIYFNGI